MARKTSIPLLGSAPSSFVSSKSGFVFDAGAGDDTVLGSKHADVFLGGAGHDRLLGKKGHDVLQGGAGLDKVTGNQGSDTFVFAPGDLITSRSSSDGHKDQVDRVTDFQGAGASGSGAQDVIRLEGFGAGTALKYVAKDGAAQVYEVVDPTTAGRDGFIAVSMPGGSRTRLTADDVVVEPNEALRITNVTEGGNSSSFAPIISADGSAVAFHSYSVNLVAGQTDENGDILDVFVHDVATGETVNITDGGDADSYNADVSADGSRVAFTSHATNLVGGRGDGNYSSDVFVYDAATGETVNNTLSTGFGYSHSPSLSADGSSVAYAGDTDGNNTTDIFITGATTGGEDGGPSIRVTDSGYQGDSDYEGGSSGAPSLSADGSRVAFHSDATNLVEGEVDQNNLITDVFVHDVATGETVNVTQGGNEGSYGAGLSADGSKVVFSSQASNLVDGETDQDGRALDVFIHDLETGRTINITEVWPGEVGGVSISADGSTVAFLHLPSNQQPTPYDPIYEQDVILYDVATGETTNVTADWDGYAASVSLSADGSAGTFSGVPKTGMYSDVFTWDWV